MKTVGLMAALVAGLALIAAPAEAAKKRQAPAKRMAVASAPYYPNAVYSYDGDMLGADPDPFIRMMLIREGKPRDQSGI
jgi:hypothetical protein